MHLSRLLKKKKKYIGSYEDDTFWIHLLLTLYFAYTEDEIVIWNNYVDQYSV